MELPVVKSTPKSSEFMFRAAQQMFCIPAEAGDQVKLTVIADSAHPYKLKEGAVAIVVMDPSGAVIKRDKLARDDFSKSRREDGRHEGRRNVSFQTTTAGTYGFFLNGGGPYAYTLGPCSHA